jgi:hypothetical protein
MHDIDEMTCARASGKILSFTSAEIQTPIARPNLDFAIPARLPKSIIIIVPQSPGPHCAPCCPGESFETQMTRMMMRD